MAQMVSGFRIPRRRQTLCRRDTPCRKAVRGTHRQEKIFEDTGGARRTDSGVVQIQRQLPVFTQGAPAYDVLIAADESDVFCRLSAVPDLGCPTGRWTPPASSRPVGTLLTINGERSDAGAVHEAVLARNDARDMQAWSAARMIGESASRNALERSKAMLRFFSRVPISLWPRSKASG
jgi:hypothetical protein